MSRFVSVITVAATTIALSGCRDSLSPSDTEFTRGPEVAFGNGTVRSFIEESQTGVPLSLGIELTEGAIAGLGSSAFSVTLPMPAAVPPYNHITLDWNPAGHPPAGVYTVPHFDVHFYMVTPQERAAITPADPQFAAKAAKLPAPEFIPQGYVKDPGAVPNMGSHWTDPVWPEFSGDVFTRSFVWGSWDGNFTYYEPMVSQSFLEAKPNRILTFIKVPARYAKPGYHPTVYLVEFDGAARLYRIALLGFVRQD